MLDQNRKIHSEALAAHNGTLLKEMGDGMLASFPSASDAVQCAQQLVKATGATGTYELRVGVHLGEVIRTEGDVFGDGVNIASRIQDSATPGHICISAEVYNNVRNKIHTEAKPLGEVELKNIGQKVYLFQLQAFDNKTNTN
jgi:class 3 adenylate cyclase